MQVTPIVNLLRQAQVQTLWSKKSMTPAQIKALGQEDRVTLFEQLVKQLGGTLYTLFDKDGIFTYAAGNSLSQAVAYVLMHRSFRPVLYSTERTKSCGGKRLSKLIAAEALPIYSGRQIKVTVLNNGAVYYNGLPHVEEAMARLEKTCAESKSRIEQALVKAQGGIKIHVDPDDGPNYAADEPTFDDPSAMRDHESLQARVFEKPKEPAPPKVVEHPLLRVWPITVTGR